MNRKKRKNFHLPFHRWLSLFHPKTFVQHIFMWLSFHTCFCCGLTREWKSIFFTNFLHTEHENKINYQQQSGRAFASEKTLFLLFFWIFIKYICLKWEVERCCGCSFESSGTNCIVELHKTIFLLAKYIIWNKRKVFRTKTIARAQKVDITKRKTEKQKHTKIDGYSKKVHTCMAYLSVFLQEPNAHSLVLLCRVWTVKKRSQKVKQHK